MNYGNSGIIGQAEVGLGLQLLSFTYKFNQWGTVRHVRRALKSNAQILHIAFGECKVSVPTEQFEKKRWRDAVILVSLGKVKI